MNIHKYANGSDAIKYRYLSVSRVAAPYLPSWAPGGAMFAVPNAPVAGCMVLCRG